MVSKRFRPFSLRLLSCAAAASALAALLAPRREGRSMAAMLSPPVSRPRVCRVGSCSETPARTSRVRGNGSRAIGGSKFELFARSRSSAPQKMSFDTSQPILTERHVSSLSDETRRTQPRPNPARARAGRRHVTDRPPRTGARPLRVRANARDARRASRTHHRGPRRRAPPPVDHVHLACAPTIGARASLRIDRVRAPRDLHKPHPRATDRPRRLLLLLLFSILPRV